MRDFIALFAELDATSRTSVKLDALKRYFDRAPADDGAWAVYMLTGRRMKRLVGARKLRAWVTEACGLPSGWWRRPTSTWATWRKPSAC